MPHHTCIVASGPDARSVRTAAGEFLHPLTDPAITGRQYCVLGSGHTLLPNSDQGSSLISRPPCRTRPWRSPWAASRPC